MTVADNCGRIHDRLGRSRKFVGEGGQREELHARARPNRKRERGRERGGLEDTTVRRETARCALRSVPSARGRECVTNKCLPAARRTGICIRTHNATPSLRLRSRLASCYVTFPSPGRARSALRAAHRDGGDRVTLSRSEQISSR